MKKITTLLSITFFFPLLISAQGIYPINNYKSKVKYNAAPKCIQAEQISILLGAGGSAFSGKSSKAGSEVNTLYSAGIDYRFSNYLSLKNEFNYFGLSATNSKQAFESKNMELSTSIKMDLFPRSPFDRQKTYTPYVFLGVGILQSNIKSLNNSSKNNICPIIPVGLGLTLKHSKNFSLLLEGSYRLATSNKLDGRSKTPLNTGFDGTVANRPSDTQGYFMVSAKIKYTLNRKFYSKANDIIESANILN